MLYYARRHEVVFIQKNETHIGHKEKDSFLHTLFLENEKFVPLQLPLSKHLDYNFLMFNEKFICIKINDLLTFRAEGSRPGIQGNPRLLQDENRTYNQTKGSHLFSQM